MYSKLGDIAAYIIRVEDGADHVYDLPHPVAEPSLDMAVDVCVEVLQTLLTGSVHSEFSVLIASGSTMRPSGPPGGQSRRPGEAQPHCDPEPGIPRSPGHRSAIGRPRPCYCRRLLLRAARPGDQLTSEPYGQAALQGAEFVGSQEIFYNPGL